MYKTILKFGRMTSSDVKDRDIQVLCKFVLKVLEVLHADLFWYKA